ncbi:hypothetical protein HPB51_025610 [Rhipicephalus microplus]|uniref:THAP-type domain-containing protein n=1 Tax=Rhipicephalus microplus TaxID=6941 RepID=A0A9J6D8S3_RHIMP|nr:hypothetical protein HPB51_025610 [Rhipicephalus microplus]
MGRCCVPNSRGNYDTGPKVRVFSFPKDARRVVWERAVRRDDVDIRSLRDPKVCELHFKPEYLRTTTTYTDPTTGRKIEAAMGATRLTPDAVPTIFPNSPAYLSDCAPVREEPEEKRKRREASHLEEAIRQSISSHEEEDRLNKLQSYEDLVSQLQRVDLSSYWTAVQAANTVLFLHVEGEDPPEVERSVVVSRNMEVTAFWRKAKLPGKDLLVPSRLGDLRCLQTALDSARRFRGPDVCVKDDKVKATFNLLFSLLDSLSSDDLLPQEKIETLGFIKEQLELLQKNDHSVRAPRLCFGTEETVGLAVVSITFVSQSSEHGCALDPLPLLSSSVVDCRASTEAYQVACDRCEAEFIVPVAVSSAPAPASRTDYHVVLPARINCLTSAIRSSSGLGSSTTGKMLNNPFLCTLQVLASLFVSQSSEHGCALDPLPLPSSSVVDCRASTEAYQVACDRCEAEFIVPGAVSSAPAPASGTDYHVVLPARINCLTSAIPSSGLGSSTTGKMLNNPFLCTLQSFLVGAWLLPQHDASTVPVLQVQLVPPAPIIDEPCFRHQPDLETTFKPFLNKQASSTWSTLDTDYLKDGHRTPAFSGHEGAAGMCSSLTKPLLFVVQTHVTLVIVIVIWICSQSVNQTTATTQWPPLFQYCAGASRTSLRFHQQEKVVIITAAISYISLYYICF